MDSLEGHLDRDWFSVGTLDDDDARRYWLARTPDERLSALEYLRQVMYDYDPVTDRVEKVLEVAQLGRR